MHSNILFNDGCTGGEIRSDLFATLTARLFDLFQTDSLS
jgi:hypothetical protein